MGLLAGSSAYLAGAIDSATDPNSWRNQITRDLFKPLGIKVYNPLIKPSWMSPNTKADPGLYKKSLQVIEQGGLNGFGKACVDEWNSDEATNAAAIGTSAMIEIRDVCLRMAADASFIVCSLPKTFTVGTFEELGLAKQCGKPILFHMPDGLDSSTWLPVQFSGGFFSSFYEESYFRGWDSLYQRIRDIDGQVREIDKAKWVFATYFNDPDIQSVQ